MNGAQLGAGEPKLRQHLHHRSRHRVVLFSDLRDKTLRDDQVRNIGSIRAVAIETRSSVAWTHIKQ
jgi:predicted subunit of tRNA(5-methylaminomethyl-2-thiouridylate) methyltransferase